MSSEAFPSALDCAPGAKEADRKEAVVSASKPRSARTPIRVEDLPPPGITRWVIRRKAQVVAAVQSGALSLEEVCSRYSVSVEEFRAWQKSLQRHGIYGLRVTRAQIYRDDLDAEDGAAEE
jgi:hypothetical protein